MSAIALCDVGHNRKMGLADDIALLVSRRPGLIELALAKSTQRELFDNAGSMGELLNTSALRGQIARFLHKHKNDENTAKTIAAA